jgi:hypothetical protein
VEGAGTVANRPDAVLMTKAAPKVPADQVDRAKSAVGPAGTALLAVPGRTVLDPVAQAPTDRAALAAADPDRDDAVAAAAKADRPLSRESSPMR